MVYLPAYVLAPPLPPSVLYILNYWCIFMYFADFLLLLTYILSFVDLFIDLFVDWYIDWLVELAMFHYLLTDILTVELAMFHYSWTDILTVELAMFHYCSWMPGTPDRRRSQTTPCDSIHSAASCSSWRTGRKWTSTSSYPSSTTAASSSRM